MTPEARAYIKLVNNIKEIADGLSQLKGNLESESFEIKNKKTGEIEHITLDDMIKDFDKTTSILLRGLPPNVQ